MRYIFEQNADCGTLVARCMRSHVHMRVARMFICMICFVDKDIDTGTVTNIHKTHVSTYMYILVIL